MELEVIVANPIERILMFCVGVVFVFGSIKFLLLSFEATRTSWQAISMGILGFMLGIALCVWGVVGPPG